MDEVEDLYPQYMLYINSGGWGEIGTSMNYLIEWFKKRNRKQKLKDYIRDCIRHGEFEGASGKKLNSYIDCRPLVANSFIRLNIVKAFYDLIDDVNVIFAGIQTSGAILATELALFRKTDAIIINLFKEPIYPYNFDCKGKKIVLVDDVITTGYTIKKSIESLRYGVDNILCIVNRSNLKDIDGIEIKSIFDYRDFNLGNNIEV